MSNVSRGLFDPRRKMQHWPEPNDDPNIPYAWGEGGLGYAISGYRSNESDVEELPSDISPTEDVQVLEIPEQKTIRPLPSETVEELYKGDSPRAIVKPVNLKAQPKEPINETVVSVAVASSMVLGVWGLLDGYSQSQNTGGERIFDSLEKAVIYATGVGFIASKLKKG